MSGSNANAGDTITRRLQQELSEKENLVRSIFDRANAANRDMDDNEKAMVAECRGRMEAIKEQLDQVAEVNPTAYETRSSARILDEAMRKYDNKPDGGAVEYRSGGEYILDIWRSHNGDRESAERLDTYYRAAAHQKTSD